MTDTINSDGTVPQATSGYLYSIPGQSPIAISSSTNASPIEVTTTTSHGFNDGDTVEIEGHAVNTTANGLWVIQKTAANKFKLVGSTPTAAGGATGIAIDYAINPLLTIPEDLVDDVDASTVNPAFEGLFDLSPFLYRRVGAWCCLDFKQHLDGVLFTTFSTTALNSSTWTDLGVVVTQGDRYLKAGDILDLTFFSSVSCSASGAVAMTFAINFDFGAGYTGPQEQIQFAQDFIPGTSGIVIGQAVHGLYVYGGGGIPARYKVSMVGLSSSGTPNILLSGSQQLIIRHYRPNNA